MVPRPSGLSVRRSCEHMFCMAASANGSCRLRRGPCGGRSERLLDRRPGRASRAPTVQRWRRRGWATGERDLRALAESPSPNGTATSSAATSETVTCVHHPPNGWTLRLACDRAYPEIICEALVAMATTFPPRQPTRRPVRSAASDVLSISHHGVGSAFPQHGPGPQAQENDRARWPGRRSSDHGEPASVHPRPHPH